MVYTIYPNRAGFFFFLVLSLRPLWSRWWWWCTACTAEYIYMYIYIHRTGRVSQGNMITVSNIICTVTAYYSKGLPTQIRSIYSRLYKQQKNIT